MNITQFETATHTPEDIRLNDRVYLITGAAGAIGGTLALTLGKLGATVILMDVNKKGLDAVYDRMVEASCPMPANLVLDMATAGPEQYEELADLITSEFGRLDGMIHCAAETGTLTPLSQYPLDRWSKVLLVNLNAPYMLTRACLDLLLKAADAPVIFTTAEVARRNRAYWGAFGIAGHAVESMMQIWADELENNTPVRFNTIDPGPVRSAFRTRLYPGELAKSQPSAEHVIPAYLYLLTQPVSGIALKAQQ